MPAIGFKYPDGERALFKDMDKIDLVRMGCTLPTLKYMSMQRAPDRKPSTTELLTGTCEAYLKRTKDYYIDPQEHAFSLVGSLHHKKLEDSTDGVLESEMELEDFDITGITDLYDPETRTLVDYKNSGSYKVAKVLGMEYYLIDDPSGATYKRSGRWGKVGESKKVKQWIANPDKANLEEWGWQLNWYRYMLEKSGKPVDHVFVQITVRDGGLQVARERGVDKNIYLIEVPKIHEENLLDKFIPKRDALIEALKTEIPPDKCSADETWDGVKCERFCEVRDRCPWMCEGKL